MSEKEFELRFYTEEEIKELIKSKEELYYVDDGVDEAIIKFEDIPDFIVDYNRNFDMRNLKFYRVGKDVYEPDITTMGEYLDRINMLGDEEAQYDEDYFNKINKLYNNVSSNIFNFINDNKLNIIMDYCFLYIKSTTTRLQILKNFLYEYF